jgi:hypothetical protein
MAEYIDREKLIAEYDRVHIGVAGGARQLMVDAPTEDVVPVVRCKDCTEWDENECECSHWCGFKENDFCSYGERKANNGNG